MDRRFCPHCNPCTHDGGEKCRHPTLYARQRRDEILERMPLDRARIVAADADRVSWQDGIDFAHALLSTHDALESSQQRADALQRECDELKHDIARHMAIANAEVERADALHKALRALAIHRAFQFCRVCNTQFENGQERHAPGCLAALQVEPNVDA